MKVGIIAPIKFLDSYCVTGVQYCLPRLLVGSKPYREFYLKHRTERGSYIIMDCRKLGWKRGPEEFSIIEEALGLFHPNILVAPSYMFNKEASLEIFKEFTSKFKIVKAITVKCLEGSSKEDAVSFPKGKIVAVPSHMFRYLEGLKLGPHTVYIENHLNLDELEGRKGILVTSLPLKLGLKGRLMSDYRPSPESLTFYEEEDNYPKVIMRNIQETIEYYEGG